MDVLAAHQFLGEQWSTNERHLDHRLDCHDGTDTMVYSSGSLFENPSALTMHRYLQETGLRPLFTSPWSAHDEDAVLQPFPDVAFNSMKYTSSDPAGFHYSHQVLSPMHNGLASTYESSVWSDRRDSPLSSPNMSAGAYSPGPGDGSVLYPCGDFYKSERHDSHAGINTPISGPCVAMHDIQMQADEQPEHFEFEDDLPLYPAYNTFAVQEGYQPLPYGTEMSIDSTDTMHDTSNPDPEEERHDSASPVIRRRPTHPRQPSTSHVLASKVAKRPQASKRRRSSPSSGRQEASTTASFAGRAFPCPFAPYGCGSTFGSKNEWKRHVNTQHLRLGFWRCDQCPNAESMPNDFNRKDLFTQHVRRMHPTDSKPSSKRSNTKSTAKDTSEDQALAAASARCYRHTRSPPEESGCMFCEERFRGSSAWDERMEHIGRHMESMKKETETSVDLKDWRVDETVEAWMLEEGIVTPQGKHLVLTEPEV